MATLTVIDESNAPKKPSPGAAASALRQAQYDSYVKAVKKGQVGKLVPQGAETARGLAVRVSRAAKRTDKSAETWTVDGVVYFRIT